jgi:oligopeptide/dipeptide ABC transporter ATP-binding protein
VAVARPDPLLSVEDLGVQFWTRRGTVHAVNGITFDIAPGETLGIVGESGCGKSVTSLALMGILPRAGRVTSGTVMFGDRDLLQLADDQFRKVRGREIAMIFQDPMTSLNPVLTIGRQIREALETHFDMDKAQANARAAELLDQVGIPSAKARIKDYPHQFSGGMRQRAMIAMALACEPKLLIADEPTTALDVTIQAQILELIKSLKDDFGSAVVLITHDMGVVAEIADRVQVMYAGRIVEEGEKRQVFYDAQHPYTWGLLGSIARIDGPKPHRLTAISGQPPSLLRLPEGCSFRPRCPQAFSKCLQDPPLTDKVGGGHKDACHLAVDDKRGRRETTIHPELAETA